jgi:integrase
MKAQGVLRKRIEDLARGIPIADGKLRYGDLRAALIDDYVRERNRSLVQRPDGTETVQGLPQLDAYCGYSKDSPGVKLSDITPDWMRRFRQKRTEDGAGSAIINRSLQALRRGFNVLREEDRLTVVPKIKLMKEPPARKGFLEPQKFEELLRALPTHLRPLVATLYWTGVRKGEALSIDWSQVDLDRRLIQLEGEQTKNEEPRALPLSSPVIDLLRGIEPKRGKVFDATNLRVEWERACSACELGTRTEIKPEGDDAGYKWHTYKGLRLHDLRRSAVRNLIRAGVSQKVAMDISGHKTVNVFQRYNITSNDDVLAAMRLVETASLGLPAAKNGRRVSVQISAKTAKSKRRLTASRRK